MSTENVISSPQGASSEDELRRYLSAGSTLENTRSQLAALEQTEPVETYHQQLALLSRRLQNEPWVFRDIFIADGTQAVAWEFRQEELGAAFIQTLWELLLRDDDASKLLMRFVWDVPLKLKRKFIRALDRHLSDRYPLFKGLSENWPAENAIPPYIREPERRARDFELVNQGYLGYMNVGYSAREVELLVWLEALRDKQCEEKPCEVGLLTPGDARPKGGCPVKIHIPQMLELLGTGRFREAMELIESCNPLPNVTGRVCPQELQCQGVCAHQKRPIEIGQLEWYLPQREKMTTGGADERFNRRPDPWVQAVKPPIAVVGSGPAGLINAYLQAAEGFPVTVFEAFHALGGVLRYGIPEFRLPNELINDVVDKITLLGGKFVTNFVVGKTATLEDLKNAGFWKIFVGTGAGLPRFMNVPGEHLLNVMSANEFLTRVNLMQGASDDYETPLPEISGKRVIVIGGGNTAMDAARTALRLGGEVAIVYRRTQSEMPARVEELLHAQEEGIALKVLRAPCEFIGDDQTHFVKQAILDVMALGDPDASGRRSPSATGVKESMAVDLVIMALGNAPNPIIKDAEPHLHTTKWGTIQVEQDSQQTSISGVYSGGDASRGGSTAINAAGDGRAAALEIVSDMNLSPDEIRSMVSLAGRYSTLGATPKTILAKSELAGGIVELIVRAPLIAKAARAGQFVRVLPWTRGELIPLTLADWDEENGTICLVVQGMGSSSMAINRMQVGDAFAGIAGPLGQPSVLHRYPCDKTVVFTAGGVGLPPAYPIMREHLRCGNHVTLIAGFRNADLLFWIRDNERIGKLQADYPGLLDVIYTSNDGGFGRKGFVTGPLEDLLKENRRGGGREITEVVTIGPPLMMRAVCDLTRPYGVKTVASLNSIMVDATGMCGACMVPVNIDGGLVRKHACIDGPEIDGHIIDWDKFLPRFNQFKAQEQVSKRQHGFA
ncbi:sulfide/dihydroorotate dehydrogenase-like FAD/NAD-binding protein [Brenneria tiliae]|uniref:sulfide/dihydroorotate dehydrogenase-like FAD/NAD-binding protein n=1 Tax=Brenneria tiliae TaxID=2914984 RepID=UPI002014D7D3|nr:sulfide/dihydroorotate dehydrogenase-like FAD/NAD-binding protein [Brenneria tiliae]MCL2897320.1 sulfide/dihydroorotate dehydrogenase-like FAD/NAD-binding protein [Brenneria tiliae]MCL2901737.1 sulfide/dihydroorotate dehydrogenase-like FAD/NAD-binding protein [Brenneria tiliae]